MLALQYSQDGPDNKLFLVPIRSVKGKAWHLAENHA